MEATAAAILSLSAVINPRRAHFDGAGTERHFPRARLAIADDLGTAMLVPLLVALDLVRCFGFKGYGEHPPGSLASDLIEV